jgi:predicted nucleic acid-binding protein
VKIEEIILSFVLDTNVVSEARKGSRADAGVMSWLSSVAAEDLYLSVLVVGEIRQGIEGLRRRDSVQADHLEVWLSGLRRRYADRILPIDLEIAEEWGRMNAPDPISSRDGLMAATAKVRNMTFVTRNTSDVARTGVRLLNPFDLSS